MARRLATIQDVRWGGVSSAASLLAELKARNLQRARIGVVGGLPWTEADLFRQELPDAAFVNWARPWMRCRLVKSQEELAWMSFAAEMSDRVMEALEREVRPGLDERELPRIAENTYLGEWTTNEIHYMTTTNMHRPEICVPSQYHAARTIQAGDVLITEVSASYWGYPGQVLRPYAVAEEPTPLYQKLYDLAERAFHAVAAVMKPGGTANVITLDEKAGVQVGHLVRITADGCEPMHRYRMGFIVTGR